MLRLGEFFNFNTASTLLPIEIEAAAVDIIAEIVSAPTKIPRCRRSFLAARDFVIENYRSSLTLAEVARAVGLHRVYLGQLFVKEAQQTLGNFVNEMRVRGAAEALLCSTASLAHIAAEYGFYDQSHFSRIFRHKVGLAPGAFRRCYHGLNAEPSCNAD